jgi:hypothetical protein
MKLVVFCLIFHFGVTSVKFLTEESILLIFVWSSEILVEFLLIFSFNSVVVFVLNKYSVVSLLSIVELILFNTLLNVIFCEL